MAKSVQDVSPIVNQRASLEESKAEREAEGDDALLVRDHIFISLTEADHDNLGHPWIQASGFLPYCPKEATDFLRLRI